MTTMHVTYRGDGSARFDKEYFVHKHLPLVVEAWGPFGLLSCAAFFPEGSGHGTIAIAECRFQDDDALHAALGSDASPQVMADVARYTDLTPLQTLAGSVRSQEAA